MSTAINALAAVENEIPERQLTQCRKIIVAVEKDDTHLAARLFEALRKMLRSIEKSKGASSDEKLDAIALLARLKKANRDEDQDDDAVEAPTETATADIPAELNNLSSRRRISVEVEERNPVGFVPGTFNMTDVIARLTAAGFNANSSADDPVPMLTAPLGETPLDEKTADFLWVEIAYDFMTKSKQISPLVDKLLTALFVFSVQRNFNLHRNPLCFEHFGHRLDFRIGVLST